MSSHVEEVLHWVREKFPGEPEFHQAVGEVFQSLSLEIEQNPIWEKEKILYRLATPERDIAFRVVWEDDSGNIQINRGFRVQYSTLLGPYKGGLRFHPTVNLSVLRFLGFEQCFKNALTGLNLGGGKGGADFDPRGRSDREIMRFCQSYMTELQRHIGASTDVPAGDIGVGGREIGYLHGQYRRIRNRWEGEITGKGGDWGGSPLRPEATGYGLIYFVEHMLNEENQVLEGRRVNISGAGNVAQFAADALLSRGAILHSLSDSGGTLYAAHGFSSGELAAVREFKDQGLRLDDIAKKVRLDYLSGQRPWSIPCDIALPCATQNEIDASDARQLIANGCTLVAEGANMPSTQAAIDLYRDANVAFGPGKAANAGGVACSGLEMAQNAAFRPWSREQVNEQLYSIMENIYRTCRNTAAEFDRPTDLELGANITGFRRLGRAMLAQGLT